MSSNLNEFLEIDGLTFPVHLIDVQRSADALDADAYRTEDGILHRKLIGIYMNYTVKVGVEWNYELYNRLFNKLTEPVEFHEIRLPDETKSQTRYVSSVKDGIAHVGPDGTKYKDLSFKVTCMAPTRKA